MSFAIKLTFGLMFFFFMLTAIIEISGERKIIKVDCYDEYNNKINGLKCDENVLVNPQAKLWSIVFGLLGFISLPLVPLVLMAIDSSNTKKKKGGKKK